jgi:hypothetical protein
MEELIKLKNINDEYKAINFLYDLVNDIYYNNDNFLPMLNDFCLNFLNNEFDLQLCTGLLMITNVHKETIIKENRNLILLRAKKLATEKLIAMEVKEENHKKEIDFLLKGFECA